MTKDVWSNQRLSMRYGLAHRGAERTLSSAAIACALSFALAVIAVSIGIAHSETLGAMVDDEAGRLALFGLVFVILLTGGIVGTVMWLTAPSAQSRCDMRWARIARRQGVDAFRIAPKA